MKLQEIQNSYKMKKISRLEANRMVSPVLEVLYDLVNIMGDSCISHIKIDQKDIIFTIELDGFCIRICAEKGAHISIVSSLLATNSVEAELEEELSNLISDNAVVFDVGANVGWYTMWIAKQCPDAKIFSFEPIPYTFSYLKKNLSLNGLNSKMCYNFGLANVNEITNFFFDERCTETSSMRDLQYIGEGAVQIPCEVRRMDDFCIEKGIDKVDFIKCDVEGAELFVFQGGLEIIKKSKPIIFTEMLRKWSAKFHYHPNDIIELLGNIGYTCIALNRNGKKYILDKITEETEEMNYLFVPTERIGTVVETLSGFNKE